MSAHLSLRPSYARAMAERGCRVVTTIGWALPLSYWLTSQHAALLAALGGAVLITVANRETRLPGEATSTDGARTDEALA
jgi:hypothetical protein